MTQKSFVDVWWVAAALFVAAGTLGAAEEPSGIAAKYPGDAGIERDPDVLFYESFENKNWDKKWQERSPGHKKSGHLESDPKLVFTGKQSLRLDFDAKYGKSGAGWMHHWWKGSDVAYLRYYFRLSKGGDWRNQKIMQFHGHPRGVRYGRGAGNRPTGYDSFSAGTGIGGRKGPPWTRVILYSYWPHQKGGYGDNVVPNQGIQPKVNEEEWVCYEVMIQLNDVGKHNGSQRLWVNGQLIIEQTGMEWRKGEDMVINNIMQPCYTHSPPKPGETRSLWLDSIVMAKRYIGPVAEKKRRVKKKAKQPMALLARAVPNDALAPHRTALTSAERLAQGGRWGDAAATYRKVADSVQDGPARRAVKLRLEGLEARPALIGAIVRGVDAKGSKTVYVDFAGRAERGRIVRATGKEGTFVIQGSRMPLAWRMVSPQRLAGIAAKYADSSADQLSIAKFLLACGMPDRARKALDAATAAGASSEAVGAIQQALSPSPPTSTTAAFVVKKSKPKTRNAPPPPGAGLAWKYPEDRGIERDPDVLLFRDYEDPKSWRKGWQGNLVRILTHTSEPSSVFGGRGAVEAKLKQGTTGGAAHFILKKGQTRLYHRWYAKFPEGIHTNNKIMKSSGFGGVAPGLPDWYALGRAGLRPDGKEKLFAIVCPTADGKTGLYYYHPDQKGIWGDWVSFGPKVNYDEWTCYEFMMKLNDPDKKDGELKCWINGKLAKTISGLRFRISDQLQITQALDEAYNGVVQDYTVLYDNRVVATEYIGPMRPGNRGGR